MESGACLWTYIYCFCETLFAQWSQYEKYINWYTIIDGDYFFAGRTGFVGACLGGIFL